MIANRMILVVAPTEAVARAVTSCARQLRYGVIVVTTFAAAKRQLAVKPDLLITELKLGEYNGLHLVLRAHDIPSIVISDAAFEREIEQAGALFLAQDAVFDEDELGRMLGRILQGINESDALSAWRQPAESTTVAGGPTWEMLPAPLLH